MLLRPINQRLLPGFRTMINNGSFCFDIKSLFQDKKICRDVINAFVTATF